MTSKLFEGEDSSLYQTWDNVTTLGGELVNIKLPTPHCVQCGEIIYNDIRVGYGMCINNKCPNYGLLQVGIENIPKDTK